MADVAERSTEQSKTEEAKEKVQQKAQETAQQVQEKAVEVRGQAGSRLRREVDSRSTQTGEQVSSAAQAMRRTGEQLRSEGQDGPAKVAEAVAERSERFGAYLQEADADRILRDVEDYARRQPWLAAVGGAALGFLAARFMKASSGRRYQSGNGYATSGWQPGTRAIPSATGSSETGSFAVAEKPGDEGVKSEPSQGGSRGQPQH